MQTSSSESITRWNSQRRASARSRASRAHERLEERAVDAGERDRPATPAPDRSRSGSRAGSGTCSGPCGRPRRRAAGSRRRRARRCASRSASAHQRTMSAPSWAMTSRAARSRCRATCASRDPSASSTQPWVSTSVYGRLAREPDADHERRVEPAAVLVRTLEIDDRRAPRARASPGPLRARDASRCTARWVEPESNHTSRMSVSLRNGPGRRSCGQAKPVGQEALDRQLVPARPSPARASAPRPAPSRRDRAAASRTGLAVDGGDAHAPGPLPRQAPVGTGAHRLADRGCCEAGGSQRTCRSIASSARSRALAWSMIMNHWSVARKITGLVAAPAVRVGVDERAGVEQPPALAEPAR